MSIRSRHPEDNEAHQTADKHARPEQVLRGRSGLQSPAIWVRTRKPNPDKLMEAVDAANGWIVRLRTTSVSAAVDAAR